MISFKQVGLPGNSVSKESACRVGELGLIPGPGRSPEEGNGHPLQYPCLDNPMDRGVWWVTVHGVAKSRTWLSDWAHKHALSLFCALGKPSFYYYLQMV